MKGQKKRRAETPAGGSLVGASVRIGGIAVLYTALMFVASFFDRSGVRAGNLFESIVIEVYDWIVFPASVLVYYSGVESRFGVLLAFLAAGLLWGVLILLFVWAVRNTYAKLSRQTGKPRSPTNSHSK